MQMIANDIIIRLTKNPDNSISHEILIGVSDEEMVPELERVAGFISKSLKILYATNAEIEYAEAINHAEKLGKGKLIVPPNEIIVEH